MKLLRLSYAFVLLGILLFTSCLFDENCKDGEGPIISSLIPISDFTGIDLAEAANVIITQGSERQVLATGHENIVNALKTGVSGDIWTIDLDNGCYRDYELTINITVPNINTIFLSGSGNITVNDFEDQDDLDIKISGSGNISLGRFSGCENVSVNISGSGNITGNDEFPELNNLDIKIGGSGNFNAFLMITDECEISIPGSGSCSVHVLQQLDVTISGSGTVFFKGHPTINSHITGSGSIVDAN